MDIWPEFVLVSLHHTSPPKHHFVIGTLCQEKRRWKKFFFFFFSQTILAQVCISVSYFMVLNISVHLQTPCSLSLSSLLLTSFGCVCVASLLAALVVTHC